MATPMREKNTTNSRCQRQYNLRLYDSDKNRTLEIVNNGKSIAILWGETINSNSTTLFCHRTFCEQNKNEIFPIWQLLSKINGRGAKFNLNKSGALNLTKRICIINSYNARRRARDNASNNKTSEQNECGKKPHIKKERLPPPPPFESLWWWW